MCAGGPPNPITPIRLHSRAMVAKPTRPPSGAVLMPESLSEAGPHRNPPAGRRPARHHAYDRPRYAGLTAAGPYKRRRRQPASISLPPAMSRNMPVYQQSTRHRRRDAPRSGRSPARPGSSGRVVRRSRRRPRPRPRRLELELDGHVEEPHRVVVASRPGRTPAGATAPAATTTSRTTVRRSAARREEPTRGQ